jgi:hypothetical protein
LVFAITLRRECYTTEDLAGLGRADCNEPSQTAALFVIAGKSLKACGSKKILYLYQLVGIRTLVTAGAHRGSYRVNVNGAVAV